MELRGTPEHVAAQLPRQAVPVQGRLRAGPCTLAVTPNGIQIERGSDRLRIPPPARLLQWNDRYYLYTQDRKAAVLRVYSFLK